MLTIKNIDKIKEYAFGGSWVVDEIVSDSQSYGFIVQRWNGKGKIDYVCRIDVMRNRELGLTSEPEKLYMIKLDNVETKQLISANYISNMQNLVEVFSDILAHIPKR